LKSAVFITSGIGNSIFLVPLIRAISEEQKPILLAKSPFHSERIFAGYQDSIFSESINLYSIPGYLKLIKFIFKPLDTIYLDFFSASRMNLIIAHLISKEIVSNKTPDSLPNFIKAKIRLVFPKVGLHEAEQYLRFQSKNIRLSESMLRLEPKKVKPNIPKPYATIQIGAGNNLTPWKIWPIEQWQASIQKLLETYPNLQLVLLGDEHDYQLGERMTQISPRLVNLIDKTRLEDLPGLIAAAEFHVGGDSGLLQIAGTVGTNSVTIIGGSDPEIFGWHKINPAKHKIIQHKLGCHPRMTT
jgi:ADP-heptose:LPS heptosyltransferase